MVFENRNPAGFAPGDRVKVVVASHRDYGKSGAIVSLAGIADDQRGKPRAHIRVSENVFIHVSLPNLAKV